MLVATFLGLVLLALALLAVPLACSFRLAVPPEPDNAVSLQWAFGLVTKQFDAGGSIGPAASAGSSESNPASTQQSPRVQWPVLKALRDAAFRRRLAQFCSDLWSGIRKEKVHLHLRVGLGDPADTGQLWGLLGPLSGLLATIRDASIRIEPDFQNAVCALHGSGRVRIVPLQIVCITAALLCSPSLWRGVSRMRQARR
jgi:hypothetical protein